MAAALTAAPRAHLLSLASDLRFILDGANVEPSWQARLRELGVTTLALISGLDERREDVRQLHPKSSRCQPQSTEQA